MKQAYDLIVVTGPTASGKTSFAANLAYRIHGEIISADSRQLYKHMNIGTGKDYDDYLVNGIRIPSHLIDIAEPGYKYSIFEFQRDFTLAYNDIRQRNRMPLLCGGSGMYISSVTRQYRLDEVPVNPVLRKNLESLSLDELTILLTRYKLLHNKTDIDTHEHAIRAIEIEQYYIDHPTGKQKNEMNILFTGIIYDREVEKERITARLNQRLETGMVEEVKQLLDSGIPADALTYYGLEYRFITDFLTGKTDYNTMKKLLNIAIHQFAKRQRTWFRKMEKEGCYIHWIDGRLSMEEKLEKALNLL